MGKPILWASRHELDVDAEKELLVMAGNQGQAQIITQEILWPAEQEECVRLALELAREFDLLAGVWPAQAIEAFRLISIGRPVYSPVSMPVVEPDGRKTRQFRFVRWARLF